MNLKFIDWVMAFIIPLIILSKIQSNTSQFYFVGISMAVWCTCFLFFEPIDLIGNKMQERHLTKDK